MIQLNNIMDFVYMNVNLVISGWLPG